MSEHLEQFISDSWGKLRRRDTGPRWLRSIAVDALAALDAERERVRQMSEREREATEALKQAREVLDYCYMQARVGLYMPPGSTVADTPTLERAAEDYADALSNIETKIKGLSDDILELDTRGEAEDSTHPEKGEAN